LCQTCEFFTSQFMRVSLATQVWGVFGLLQQTATPCDTLQHTAIHCNTAARCVWATATHCNMRVSPRMQFGLSNQGSRRRLLSECLLDCNMSDPCHHHINERVTPYIWMKHIMRQGSLRRLLSACLLECNMSALRHHRIYEWVTSHIWMSHVTYMNESRHIYEWVTSHTWMSHIM